MGRRRKSRKGRLKRRPALSCRRERARSGRFFWQLIQASYLIADTDEKHGLLRLFHDVDNPVLLIFEEDRFAIR